MIDQEFHGGQDNEFTPPLAERARVERFGRPPSEEAPRREESAFSAQALRDAEAEDAQREQRRRRAMKSRPLVQVTAAAMAVVVTGGVAMQPVPLPEPVAEIVEVIETPEPGIVPPDDVRAWLDKMMALCEADAEDETLLTEMDSEAADASFAWWTQAGLSDAQRMNDWFYYDGTVHDGPSDAPALSLNHWFSPDDALDITNSLAGDNLVSHLRYLRTGSAFKSQTEGILLLRNERNLVSSDYEYGTNTQHTLLLARAKGVIRDWAPVQGETVFQYWNEVTTPNGEETHSFTISTTTSGNYQRDAIGRVFLEDGAMEYQLDGESKTTGHSEIRFRGSVQSGILTLDHEIRSVEQPSGEITHWIEGENTALDIGSGSLADVLYHCRLTQVPW